MFFGKFPKSFYKVNNFESIMVTDFIRAVKLDASMKENDLYVDTYQCKDNETPEIVSHKFYGNTQYHWVIMLLNEKFDPYNDFPKSDDVVRKSTINTFGSLEGVHHYVDSEGYIVDEFASGKIPVTNYEHMTQLNEAKRSLKILKKELLSEFVQNYAGLINV